MKYPQIEYSSEQLRTAWNHAGRIMMKIMLARQIKDTQKIRTAIEELKKALDVIDELK